MHLEPKETRYPLCFSTRAGNVLVARHRQLYQNIELEIKWLDAACTTYLWIVLGDNCEDGFDVVSDKVRGHKMAHASLRRIAKAWLDHWESKTR